MEPRKAQIIVKDAPAEVVAAVVGDARTRDVTFQEAAVSVLCGAFKVPYSPSGRRFVNGTVGGTDIHLEVPGKLRRKLRQRAYELEGTIRGVVLAALADHYGLQPVDPGRRARGK